MSTTRFEVTGSNKALFRGVSIAGSALIWTGLGYLALTYVPKFDRQPADTDVTIVGVPPEPIIVPPPPIIDPPIVKQQQVSRDDVSIPTPPTLSVRTPKSTTPNPLVGELPSGPVSPAPVTFAPPQPVGQGQEWQDPVILVEPPAIPVAQEPPAPTAPAPQLVINPVRIAGSNPVFPNRALDRGVGGEVTLFFTVSPSGKVEGIEVTGEDPRGYGFARAAREAIQGWTFQPQTIDGIPVAYPARYTISFKLED
jgi:periplasmic protein TonB